MSCLRSVCLKCVALTEPLTRALALVALRTRHTEHKGLHEGEVVHVTGCACVESEAHRNPRFIAMDREVRRGGVEPLNDSLDR